MTERKPRELSFASWVDQQIEEAARRGAFDNLPGAGQPLPRRDGPDDGQAWLRDYARREGVSTDELLPAPLRLRKELERLAETVPRLRSEQEVRDVVGELNERILQWRRIPVGPPVFVPLADPDAMVSRWLRGQATAAGSEQADAPAGPPGTPGEPAARRRWWRRLGGGPG